MYINCSVTNVVSLSVRHKYLVEEPSKLLVTKSQRAVGDAGIVRNASKFRGARACSGSNY